MSKKAVNHNDIVRIAAEVGAAAGVKAYEKEKAKAKKELEDRRLRNTKLLLQNYRTLKLHLTESVCSEEQLYENIAASALEILYGLDDQDDETLYIESINRSQMRTEIIMQHIDHMLYIYKTICENSKYKEDMRRYKVLHAMYIAPALETVSVEDVAEQEYISVRTVYNDLSSAYITLSALFFGIDGLRLKKWSP